MAFEWDKRKAASNLRKHGIDFAEAALVLEDEMALTMPDPSFKEEQRFITQGCDPRGRLLVVVFTWRGDNVRLISARKATKAERRHYEAEK